MSLPTRLTPQHPLRKLVAALLIAIVSTALAIALHHVPGVSTGLSLLDTTMYDSFYRARKSQRRAGGSIVIVAVDESSIRKLSALKMEWPWPRNIWAALVKYMGTCGAKALVFDVEFQDKRNFDKEFAAALDDATIPVIIATKAQGDGKPDTFAPPVTKFSAFGAVNLLEERVARRYPLEVHGLPTLAVKTLQGTGSAIPQRATDPFWLHYYGPHERPDGQTTFRFLEAASVCRAAAYPKEAAKVGISPDMFAGKIVLVGGTATGTFDLKSSPLTYKKDGKDISIYPGVEIHATAIDNLLNAQIVEPVPPAWSTVAALLASILATLGVVFPRRVTLKVFLAFLAWLLLFAAAIVLFIGSTIHWLAMASPIIAILLATIGAFAWSYLTEDRQRRFVLKALAQYLSPEVAAEISRNPDALKLGGERREMTVLFSDIQGFTDLSESMPSEKLSQVLNYYLGEMSALILQNNGTLDKYIGDAIMCFWNAPLSQSHHAELACRAALAMRTREAEILGELGQLGAANMLTRIGINTGPMVVGNMGSPQKFNYSVLGDSVNLGSRLEGANKLYGSRILISETTAALVKDKFALRQLDVLRVKGKQQPLAVYELMAEGAPDAPHQELIDNYERGFRSYQQQKWDEAEAVLQALRNMHPQDLPTQSLLARIAKLRHDPPGANWDGVYVAKEK